MRFDDTLETVLASDLSTPYGVQSAWRQIVDLIGRRRAAAGTRAMGVLRSIRDSVPLPVRAASARALEHADPPPPLVRLFALDELAVALPVLRSARMNSAEWIQLLPELAPATRAVLRNRRDLSPVVRRALESFGPVDFVLPDETVKDVPAAAAGQDASIAEDPAERIIVESLTVDWSDIVNDGAVAFSDAEEEPNPAALDPQPLSSAHETPSGLAEMAEDANREPQPSLPEASAPLPADQAVLAEAVPEGESQAGATAGLELEPEAPPLVYWRASQVAADTSLAALLARLPAPGQPVAPVEPKLEVAAAELEAPISTAELQAPIESDAPASPEPADTTVEPEPMAEDLSFVALAGLAPSLTHGLVQVPEPVEIPVRSVQSGTDESLAPIEPIAAPEAAAQGAGMDYSDGLVAEEARQIAAEAGSEDDGTFEIAEVVARIDAFWRHREATGPVEHPAPRPADEFRFETDAKGMIRWVEGVSRAPLVGVSLDSQSAPGLPDGSRVDGVAAGAFRRRAGFSNARLAIEGESDAAGDWLISAIPVFDPSNGRFTGYRGTARRPRADERAEPLRQSAPLGMPADSLRQLVHELRTPTNAIAGFAEMIEAQMLGPVGDAYRDRAQVIRSQARELLGAIDDLDLAARIDSAALALVPGEIALRPVLAGIADDLAPLAELRGSVIALPIADLAVAGDRRAVERLLARLLATLVSASGPGERIGVRVASEGAEMVAITIDRPKALADYPGDQVLDIDDEREDATLLGTGFALRLARNLAHELGGALVIGPESLTLRLPAAVNGQVGQAHQS